MHHVEHARVVRQAFEARVSRAAWDVLANKLNCWNETRAATLAHTPRPSASPDTLVRALVSAAASACTSIWQGTKSAPMILAPLHCSAAEMGHNPVPVPSCRQLTSEGS